MRPNFATIYETAPKESGLRKKKLKQCVKIQPYNPSKAHPNRMTTTSRLTLTEIGKMAGVSRSTVSRVINNQGNVNPNVRKRVQQVIEETGYRPNSVARSLAGQKMHMIGLVIPQTAQILFTDPFFPHLIQGIAHACNQHNYTLSLFLMHASDDEATLYQRLLENTFFDGIILTADYLIDDLVPEMLKREIPFVHIGHHDDSQVSYVDADNLTGAYTAVSHLSRLGYQRIATITGPMNNLAAVHRQQGYLNALRDRGHSVTPELIATGDFSEAGGKAAMKRLLSQKPDAVFAASDAMALGALRAIRQANLNVPQDIALVGYDDLPPATHADPALTTVRQPVKQVGSLAAEILFDMVDNGRFPPRRIILPTELVIRASCGVMFSKQ